MKKQMSKNVLLRWRSLTFLAFGVLMSWSIKTSAQNLVQNPSFETNTGEPMALGQFASLLGPNIWNVIDGVPVDYFSTQATQPIVGVPNNSWGFQVAQDGERYAGIEIGRRFLSNNDKIKIREFPLGSVGGGGLAYMNPGEKYQIRFYVNLANESAIYLKGNTDFQARVSSNSTPTPPLPGNSLPDRIWLDPTTPPGFYDQTTSPNKVETLPFEDLDDTLNWIPITGYYNNNHTNALIAVGLFEDNLEEGVNFEYVNGQTPPNAPFDDIAGYYYIDDVSVLQCDWSCDELSLVTNRVNSPNPNECCYKLSLSNGNNPCDLYGVKISWTGQDQIIDFDFHGNTSKWIIDEAAFDPNNGVDPIEKSVKITANYFNTIGFSVKPGKTEMLGKLCLSDDEMSREIKIEYLDYYGDVVCTEKEILNCNSCCNAANIEHTPEVDPSTIACRGTVRAWFDGHEDCTITNIKFDGPVQGWNYDATLNEATAQYVIDPGEAGVVKAIFLDANDEEVCVKLIELDCPFQNCCNECEVGDELVDNGDFSRPGEFTNYSSDFYNQTASPPLAAGEIDETDDANLVDAAWQGTDHTGNGSRILIADGFVGASKNRAWYQNVNVEEGKDYCFSAWIRNPLIAADPNNRPSVELLVGGLSTSPIASHIDLANDEGWVQICGTYHADASQAVELDVVLYDKATATNNVLLIDDISLRELKCGTGNNGECCEEFEITTSQFNSQGMCCFTTYVNRVGQTSCDVHGFEMLNPYGSGHTEYSTTPINIAPVGSQGYQVGNSICVPPYALPYQQEIKIFGDNGQLLCSKFLTIDCGHQSSMIEKPNAGNHSEFTDNTELSLSCAPNPAAGHTVISYDLPEEGEVRIEVFSTFNKRVKAFDPVFKSEGQSETLLKMQGIEPGIYIVRLSFRGREYHTRLWVTK